MLRKYLPHCAIILSVMYFVFFFIDKFNAPMAFINNGITKAMLFVLGVISIINAMYVIRIDRQRLREQMSRQRRYAARPEQRRQPEGRYAGRRGGPDGRYAAGSLYERPERRRESASPSRYNGYR